MAETGLGGRAATWYVRHGERVRGPYPAGIISSYLILGRILIEDDVSLDGEHWQPLEAHPELIPTLLRDDVVDEGRLMAARRWHDERRYRDRRRDRSPSTAPIERRNPGDRRRAQAAGVCRRRSIGGSAAEDDTPPLRRRRLPMVAIALFLAGGAYLSFHHWERAETGAMVARDCRASASPGVDWSHCMKAGAVLEGGDLSAARLAGIALSEARLRGARLVAADLSYADLQGADLRDADLTETRLVGVNLRNADLAGARLAGARLLYADLRGASIDGAAFDGADLGQAIWVDGRLCATGSLGICRRSIEDDDGEQTIP